MAYTCSVCEYTSSTKLGKCPNCGQFATFEENTTISKRQKSSKHNIVGGNILETKKYETMLDESFVINNKEFQRVLGKGLKKGGMYLLG
ncbi:MAG: hypothetical protein GXP45_01870 [bacterium]|nr:hypothetical protein [bacterium]